MTVSAESGASARPLYEHIKSFVRDHVESGAWPPGYRVPSENDLVNQFSVSRMTANRALRELQQEGVLSRRPGVGTFVRQPTRRTSLIDIRNIADEINSRGNRHSCTIETRGVVIAAAKLATAFEMEPGGELYHLRLVHRERIGRNKAVPVQLEERWINLDVVPNVAHQNFKAITPTAFLLASVEPDEVEHTVSAIRPSRDQQRLLDVRQGEPCLALRRRSWSDKRVVTVADLVYPATRYTLYGRHRPAR